MQNITSDTDILSNCLEQIERGHATIESCIRRYPEFKELGDLLQTACVMRDLPVPKLNTASRSAIEQKMLSRFQQTQAVRAKQLTTSPRPAPRFSPRPNSRSGGWAMRLASAAFILILFFFTGSAGLVQAASSAMPGDGLYNVKRGVEQFQLSVADRQSRPSVLEHIASARLTEIKTLSDRGLTLDDAFVNDAITTVHDAVLAQRNFQTRDLLLWQARTTFAYAGERGAIHAAQQTTLVTMLDSVGQNPGNPSTTTIVNTDPTNTATNTLVFTDTPADEATSTFTATVLASNTPKPSSTPKLKPTTQPTNKPRPTQAPTKKPTQPKPTNPSNGGGNGNAPTPSGNGNGNATGGSNSNPPPASGGNANGNGNGGNGH